MTIYNYRTEHCVATRTRYTLHVDVDVDVDKEIGKEQS